jgi:hypothetical protein
MLDFTEFCRIIDEGKRSKPPSEEKDLLHAREEKIEKLAKKDSHWQGLS